MRDINFNLPKKANRKGSVPEPMIFTVMHKKISRSKLFRQTTLFAVFGLLLVLVMQAASYLSSAKNSSGEILGVATTAYEDLNGASKNLSQQNLAEASKLFESASNNLKLAQSKLDNYKALTWVAPKANSADHILTGAGFLASAGEKLTQGLNILGEIKVSSKGVEGEFEQKLIANKQILTETRTLVSEAAAEFSQVDSIPLDYEDTLQKAKDQVSQLGTVLDKLIGLENMYLGIFGGQKTYLLIFQNYDEQRATGGFIGTYGVLKTSHGSIERLNIDSIYDLDGKITELVAAPGPFQPEIKRWGIRDANWFVDFPTSAEKLLYFFEKGQETADGVIATTPKFFEDLLTLVGPIEMKDYNVILTAENFQSVVQYKTSIDYDRQENEPKKMLADFAPMLLDKLTVLPQDKWLQFFQIMQDNLSQRHILIYSKDPNVEKSIEDLGFSGKILPANHDYLNIINTNLGGTKTDLKIDQSVSLKSKILSDGSIVNTLSISRKNIAATFNKNFLRVMVPLGSEFVSSVGFDEAIQNSSSSDGMRTDPELQAWDKGEQKGNIFIRTESGKTEYTGWVVTEANTEKTVTITYILPFKIGSAHSLLLQKQAASKPYKFEAGFNMGNYAATWATAGVDRSGSTLNFSSNSNTDDFWGFVLNK